jgi:hypothetical protein
MIDYDDDLRLAIETYNKDVERTEVCVKEFNYIIYPSTASFRAFYFTMGMPKYLDPTYDDTDDRKIAGELVEQLRDLFKRYEIPEDSSVGALTMNNSYRADVEKEKDRLRDCLHRLEETIKSLDERIDFYDTTLRK